MELHIQIMELQIYIYVVSYVDMNDGQKSPESQAISIIMELHI